jgi:hypothetical protein
VLQAAKQLHFTRRTYRGMVRAAQGLAPSAELEALEAFLRTDAEDLKRADALALLDLLARSPLHGSPPAPKAHRTVYAHLAAREYAGRTVSGQYIADAFVLSLVKLLSPRAVRLRRHASFACLVSEHARDLGTAQHSRCSPRRVIDEVAERHGTPPRLVLGAPRMRPGVPWDTALLREARRSGEFQAMQARAARVQEFAEATARQMPGLLESLAVERLERWAAARWGISQDRETLSRALVQRGFNSYREFVDVARLAFVDEWLNDAALAQQQGLERVVRGAGVALEVG